MTVQMIPLSNPSARAYAFRAIQSAPDDFVVIIREQTRTLAQNARMWAMLTDLAEQVNWHGQYLTAENWKDVLTAALKRQQVVQGIDGGFVVLGTRTSRMTKGEMCELIDFMTAFGVQQGVVFHDGFQ